MIQISDDVLAVFDGDGVWAGLTALGLERGQMALKTLSTVDPLDLKAVCVAQADFTFWTKTLPSIYPQFTNYVARKATQPPVNPAK